MNILKRSAVGGWMVGVAALAALFLGGCGKSDHGHGGGGHSHAAPHGGALVMLGDHFAQIELVVEKERGELSLYVLDGGAHNFVRIGSPEIVATFKAGAVERTTVFRAMADAAPGETVGNTARFVAPAAWAGEISEFDCELHALEVRGRLFERVRFSYPEGRH